MQNINVATAINVAPVANAAFFFDSWGALWATCGSNHPEAAAFGPTGVARPATLAEAGLPSGHRTAWAAAQAVGRLVAGDDGDWDVLAPEPTPARDWRAVDGGLGRAAWSDLRKVAPLAEASALRELEAARRAAVEAGVDDGCGLLGRLIDADDVFVPAYIRAVMRPEAASPGATAACRRATRTLWGLAVEKRQEAATAAVFALRAAFADARPRMVGGWEWDGTPSHGRWLVNVAFSHGPEELHPLAKATKEALKAFEKVRDAAALNAAAADEEPVVMLKLPLGPDGWDLPAVRGQDPAVLDDIFGEEALWPFFAGDVRRMSQEAFAAWTAAGMPPIEVALEVGGEEGYDEWHNLLWFTLHNLKTGEPVYSGYECR